MKLSAKGKLDIDSGASSANENTLRQMVSQAVFQVAQWWAFIHAFVLLYAVAMENNGVRLSEAPFGYLIRSYFKGWESAIGGEQAVSYLIVFLFSPVVWLILYNKTGSPRLFPWRPLKQKTDKPNLADQLEG